MKREPKRIEIPDLDVIEAELERVKHKERRHGVLRGTVGTLVIVAAISILVVTLWLPFLRIYGTSMVPTLQDGEIICCLKTADFDRGDIVAFQYDNKLLVKRIIGLPGDWINIDAGGNVSVNGLLLEESYVDGKALGNGEVEFPYQTPEGRYFVLGDQRATSVDSRYTTVGCIAQEQVVGKIFVRVWPIDRITIFD